MHKIVFVLLSLSFLNGCAVAVLGGAAVSAVSVSEDNRSLGTQIDDSTRASRIADAIDAIPALKEGAHISVHVYNGVALLTGQAGNQHQISEARKMALSVTDVKQVHNQIRIAKVTAASTRAHDMWLSSKVIGKLLTDAEVNGLEIDVVVEDSEVFLMGIVSQKQAQRAIEVARNTRGIVKVFNVFEIQ